MSVLRGRLIYLPASAALSYLWNLGRRLGVTLLAQILRGLLLTLGYEVRNPFGSVSHIIKEIKLGWAVRILHMNLPFMIFALAYLHLFKAFVNGRYRLNKVWLRGIAMLLLIMGVAFLGYTLVWRQMSLWAAVVITSLLRVIPLLGGRLVLWVWGGFGVRLHTLKLFYTLHFVLPFLILGGVVYHLARLHRSGRSNRAGLLTGVNKVTFYPYFWVKDMVGVSTGLAAAGLMVLLPYKLGERDMFVEANPLMSPVHIVPEAYFLWAYAILRAVPSKLLGVVALGASFLMLFLLPMGGRAAPVLGYFQVIVSVRVAVAIVSLSWLGGSFAEAPFVGLRGAVTASFFTLLFLTAVSRTLASLLF